MEVTRYLYTINENREDLTIIYIKKKGEVMPWKTFNSNMAISLEYDLEY